MSVLLRQLARGALALPVPAGAPPVNDRGAALDEQIHRMIAILRRAGQPRFDEMSADRARVEMRKRSALGNVDRVEVHRVLDRTIETKEAEIALRIYVPERASGPQPATVYYHGGGFVIGDLDTYDPLCRFFARRSRSIVISVDYRLAPEHPFPAAADDAVAAFEWVHAHAAELGVDPARIAVAGDSAGGNLSAVVTQVMRDRGGPMPSFQLLIYPAVDMTRSCSSHRWFASDFFLPEPTIDWFLANYLSDPSHVRDPKGSPLATRDLAGLPPAHVVTSGFDPLRDEGEAYADALRAAGVPTTSRCYESLTHAFTAMASVVDAAGHAVNDLAEVLRRAHWG